MAATAGAVRHAAAAVTPAARAIQQLRRVGKIEGVSFLVLLGIAMPLKYLAHLPLAVKVVGWVHGDLVTAMVEYDHWARPLPTT